MYLTYKQCMQAGGHVRKGEKARMVVFWKWIDEKDPDTEGKEGAKATSGEDIYPQPRSCDAERGSRHKQIPFLRYYNVFHINQCEGIAARHTQTFENPAAADAIADSIISSYLQQSGVQLHNAACNRAFYRPADDSVMLPLRTQFHSTAEYYSTAFHELTHSTGHKSRLDRLEKTAFFGSEAYSKEELIAEIGAAVLVNHAELETSDSFRNNAAYIQNWLQVLKNDKRFIVSAAGKAEKAVNLILGRRLSKKSPLE